MSKTVSQLSLLVLVFLAAVVASSSQETKPYGSALELGPSTKLHVINTETKWVEYRGQHAIKLVPLPGHEHAMNEIMTAVLTDSDFKDGTIEIQVSGARRQGYSKVEDVRGFKGFIGMSFRVQDQNPETFKAETIYIRPENARLDNQFYRNSSTQYESAPDFPWDRLRQENPEVYESYVDLEPGAWTKLRIEVSGTKARLYVNGAAQPCLIVNDLKLGYGHGKIALFTRVSTDAYFSNLTVHAAP